MKYVVLISTVINGTLCMRDTEVEITDSALAEKLLHEGNITADTGARRTDVPAEPEAPATEVPLEETTQPETVEPELPEEPETPSPEPRNPSPEQVAESALLEGEKGQSISIS